MITALFVFVVVAICSPGAANLLAADAGARYGVRTSVPTILGIAVVVLAIVAVAAAGVGTFLLALPGAQLALRVAGSLCLLFLAWRILREEVPDWNSGQVSRGGFLRGALATLINPKTWTVAVTAAASYSALGDGALGLVAVLVPVFAVVVVPNLFVWAALGRVIAGRLDTPRRWRTFTAVLAGLLAVSVISLWVE